MVCGVSFSWVGLGCFPSLVPDAMEAHVMFDVQGVGSRLLDCEFRAIVVGGSFVS